jgi:Methyltransferase domain
MYDKVLELPKWGHMYFNTDKIEPHKYFQTYVKIAGELGPATDVCELGVYFGESLRMWQSLFPMGEITGVDINSSATWPEGTVKVVASQDDPNLAELVGGPFGLIVDDACHKGESAGRSFDRLWPLVQPGGYYVIEDWAVSIEVPAAYGTGMLDLGDRIWKMTHPQGSECDFVTFRWGMMIVHKRNREQ